MGTRSSKTKRRVADLLISGGIDNFVLSRRAAGRSWRLIAIDLLGETNGEIDVAPTTLSGWFSPDVPASGGEAAPGQVPPAAASAPADDAGNGGGTATPLHAVGGAP
jgi:hypothetical protein